MNNADSQQHLMAALAYLGGPVTGLVLLFTQTSPFVRFHAMQSTILFGGLIVLLFLISVIPVLGWMVLMMVSPLLYTGGFLLWVVLMWQAYRGETYRIPVIAEIVDQQLKKFS